MHGFLITVLGHKLSAIQAPHPGGASVCPDSIQSTMQSVKLLLLTLARVRLEWKKTEIEKVSINLALFPRGTMILQKESQLKEFLSLYCASLYVITSLQWVLCLFHWKRDFKLVSVCWVTREMQLFTEIKYCLSYELQKVFSLSSFYIFS